MDLVDADILIDIQRDHPPAVEWHLQNFGSFAASGFAVMELVQDARNNRERDKSLRFLAQFPIAWPSQADCHQAFLDFCAFHFSHNLGLIDSLIEATAKGSDSTPYTFNTKHYKCVPGLRIAKPYKR